MKKVILLVFSLLIGTSVFSTHIMGGEINVIDVGGNQYFVSLLLYRDANPGTVNMPAGGTNINVIEVISGTSTSHNLTEDPVLSGFMIPFFPYNVEFYYYRDTITIANPGDYNITWNSCCRNGAIQNLTNPLSESTTITTFYKKQAGAINSTPFFLVPASVYLAQNIPWVYNPLPFDLDGDSLFWTITDPLNSVGTPCAGFVLPSSDPTNPFTLDPFTGNITWTANLTGNFVASILVEEYRGGQLIGSVTRDMQFIVVPTPMGMPTIVNSNWDTDPNIVPEYYLTENQNFNLIIVGNHSDSSANVQLSAFGEVLDIISNTATFSYYPTGNGAEVWGNFSWTPQPSDTRANPYATVFRVSDGLVSFDRLVYLKVNQSTVGINENVGFKNRVKLYPNPSSEYSSVEVNLNSNEEITIELYDIQGRKLNVIYSGNLIEGTNVIEFGLTKYSSGQYFVRVISESGETTLPLTIK